MVNSLDFYKQLASYGDSSGGALMKKSYSKKSCDDYTPAVEPYEGGGLVGGAKKRGKGLQRVGSSDYEHSALFGKGLQRVGSSDYEHSALFGKGLQRVGSSDYEHSALFKGGAEKSIVMKAIQALQKSLVNHPDILSKIVGKIMGLFTGSGFSSAAGLKKKGKGFASAGSLAQDTLGDRPAIGGRKKVAKSTKKKMSSGTTSWIDHVKAVRAENKGMSYKDAMKLASESY